MALNDRLLKLETQITTDKAQLENSQVQLSEAKIKNRDFTDQTIAFGLSPLGHKHFNVLGRYHFTVPKEVLRGDLRPVRMPEEADEELQSASFRS